jgi:Tol biopolymer transport system component
VRVLQGKVVLLVWLVVLAVLAAPAHATFPGGNGRIAYTWHAGGEGFEEGPTPRLVGVFSVRPDGSGRRLIARGADQPRYSPDGRRIAFLRSFDLWVSRADGRHARRVSPEAWAVMSHQWSPRGTRLAFVRNFSKGGSAIYTVKPDGSGLTRVVKAPQPLALSTGAWSPGGNAIVYTQQSLRPLVRIVRGGRVTTLARASHGATWSSRGLIAYATSTPDGDRGQVCVRRAGSTAPERCFAYPDASVDGPAWFPDSNRLMFLHQGQGPAQIWTVRPDGGVATRAPRPNVFPIVSPAGDRLAFSEMRSRNGLAFQDLFRMGLDGGGARRLVRGGQATQPDWQPLRR